MMPAGALFAFQHKGKSKEELRKELGKDAVKYLFSKLFPDPNDADSRTDNGKGLTVQLSQGEVPSPSNAICFVQASIPDKTKNAINVISNLAGYAGPGALCPGRCSVSAAWLESAMCRRAFGNDTRAACRCRVHVLKPEDDCKKVDPYIPTEGSYSIVFPVGYAVFKLNDVEFSTVAGETPAPLTPRLTRPVTTSSCIPLRERLVAASQITP